MIYNKKGDLIKLAQEGKFDFIIHGCNCFNTMGAGIAAQIAQTFSNTLRADKRTKRGDNKKLGDYTLGLECTNEGNKLFVINAYTQYHPGPDFKLFALEMFLYRFKQDQILADRLDKVRIGVPWIGCGIGGGQKKDVKKVLYQFAASTPTIDLTIVEYKP